MSALAGSIDMWCEFLVPGLVRLDTIRIGNLVQRPLATGNGISVKARSSEDLPHDWLPTITS